MKTIVAILTAFLVSICAQVSAKIHPVENRIGSGTNTPANLNSTFIVDFTGALQSNESDLLVENYVFLGINYNNATQGSGVYSVNIEVKRYGITGNLVSTQTETLQLNNSTAQTINDKHIVAFEGFYKLECRIVSITVNGNTQSTLPGHLFVGSKIVVDRLVNFAPYASTPIPNSNIDVNYLDIDNDGISDHIRVSWADFYGAEYYDLEWVHKDNYSTDINYPLIAGDLEMSFKDKNSTRISTDLHSYDIPLIFEQGYVLFRLRPVGRLSGSPTVPVFGKWSTADADIINVGSGLVSHPLIYVDGLDENLIWQNNATFAENGKRKDVISYYDGGNKNRQTVTSLSSLKIAVVGETIYDYTGRPALQVLPSPVVNFASAQGTEVSTIRFYRDFNIKSGTTEAIAAKHFDPDGGSLCVVNAPGLSTISGASNYYSPQNSFDDGAVDFVPNAFEYPYSQTEYTPDNTGRIRRQGGVGAEHQLNSDHETFYYYGTPHQIQLDRLFGSEAGNAAHYKKNLVVDPNGVVSVSYLDMSDKVVATALVGAAPDGLSDLSQTINYQDNNQTIAEFQNNHSVIESDLFNENAEGESLTNSVDVNGNSITFSNVLLVPEEEIYTFNYDFSVNPFNPECFENLCMHCIYDLELSIVDECGEQIYSSLSTHGPMVGRFVEGTNGVQFVLDCTQGVPFELDLPQIQIQLSRGEYTISKILTVNQSAVDSYVDQIMATQQDDECILTLEDFIQIYESQVNFEDCAIEFNCAECFEELGDRFLFIATQPYSYEVNQLLYDWRYEKCKENCAVGSYCATGYQAMLLDMIASNGQYGATENGPGFDVSVFNSNNLLPKNLTQPTAYWKFPIIELNGYTYNQYLDDYGNQAKVQVFVNSNNTYSPPVVNSGLVFYENGVAYTVPENLQNLSDFVAAFQTSWAKSLVFYHPEYCFYESCREYGDFQSPQDYLTSDQFDALLNSANTFDDAFNLGLIQLNGGVYSLGNWFDETPAGEVPFSTDPADINGADQIYDPFVVRGNQLGEFYSGIGPDFLGAQLEDSFWNYTPASGGTPSLSIQELSVYLNYCPVVPNAPECAAPFNNLGNLFGSNYGNPSLFTEQKDAMWIYARSLYLSKKFELQHGRDTKYTIDVCPGYGECIGNGNFSVIENDFYESSDNPIYAVQPCNPEYADLYLDKDRRFPTPQAITVNIPSGTVVSQQCADEYNLQNLLNYINTEHSLLATDLQIGTIPQFSGVYGQVSSFSNPMSLLTQWDASVMANGNLQVLWNTPTSTLCTLIISKPALLASWNDVFYFAQLNGTTGQSVFDVTIHYYENGTIYHQDIVQGSISCVEFESCSNAQEPICTGTQLKEDFLVLCNALIADGVFYNSFNLHPTYTSYITPAITQYIGASYNPANLQWSFVGGSSQAIKVGIIQNSVEIILEGANSGNNVGFLSSVSEILSFDCQPGPPGSPRVDTYYLSNNAVKVFTGNFLPIDKQAFCNCITPPSPCCQGVGYEGWERVKSLVTNLIINTNISNGNPMGVSLYSGTDFNQFFEPYTNSVYASTPVFTHVSGTEVMSYNIGDCDLTLTLTNDPSSASWTFPNISTLSNFVLIGDPDLDGYFYQFSMTGSDGTNQFTINGQWCIPLKECTDTPPCGEVLPIPEIIIEQADPCVETLNNVILQNATYAYEQWYEDFTSTLASDYIAHCLSNIDENLRVSFMETEYHYTLYYYDQSGNLIRTVPPAGVKRLDIFSPSDPVAQRINEDRTYGTRRIFTFHNLQTTYVYNSLNQLVSQSIPDHDKMTVWETSLPLGISNDFVNQEFNFPSPSFGFAAGSVGSRGYLYKSGDAGETWSRVNGLVAADISKVRMLTTQIGYAIAEKGVILRTADGGNTWDMLDTYSTFGSRVPCDWVDFAYSTNNLPASSVTGLKMLVIGKNGFMAMLTNLGNPSPTLTIIPPTSISYGNQTTYGSSYTPANMAEWKYSSVSFDANASFIVSANFVGPLGIEYSMIFKAPVASTNSIVLMRANIADINLQSMSTFVEASVTKGFVGGDDGRLYYCPDLNSNSPEYFMIPTNHNFAFDKIYFYNSKVGIAVLRVGQNRPIYRTVDSGRTWILTSASNAKFNSIETYSINPWCDGQLHFSGARVLACGESGLIASLTVVDIAGNASVGYSLINTPSAVSNFNDIWATPVTECTSGNQKIRVIVAGDGGKLFTSLFALSNAQWNWQDISKPAITADFVKMELTQVLTTNDEYPVISGVALDQAGGLYSIFFDGVNPDCENIVCDQQANVNNTIFCPNACADSYEVVALSGTNITGNVFTHLIKEEWATAIPRIWALTETSGTPQLIRFAPTATAPLTAATSITTNWTNSTPLGNINSVIFSNSSFPTNDWLYCLTSTQEFRRMSLNSTLSEYNSDQSSRIRPTHIKALDYGISSSATAAQNRMVAVGDNGNLLFSRIAASETQWYVATTSTKFNFTSVSAANFTGGIIGTEQGTVVKYQISDVSNQLWPNTIYSPVVLTTSEPIVEVKCSAIGSNATAMYALTNTGKLLSGSNFSNMGMSHMATSQSLLKTIAYRLSSPTTPHLNAIILAGEKSNFFSFQNGLLAPNYEVFAPSLVDVNFRNALEGYVVANNYTIRHTIDGGNTWSIVLSTFPNSPNISNSMTGFIGTKVLCVGENSAILIGRNNSRPVINYINENLITAIEASANLSGFTTSAVYSVASIKKSNNGILYVVGSKAASSTAQARPMILRKLPNSTVWNEFLDVNNSTKAIRSFHIYPSNGALIVCGTAGYVNVWHNGTYLSANGYQPLPDSFSEHASLNGVSTNLSGTTFEDVYFHDDLSGYLVGNGGVLFKTKVSASATLDYEYQTTGLLIPASGYQWSAMKSNDGLNAQTSGAGYALLTLAFPTRWTGFYGGRYSGSPSGLNRKVKDEAGIFSTHFYYDRLGRIVVSQNTKQFNNAVNKKYSYTVYDELGRISEVGEKVDNSNSSEVQFREIFGLSVNGYFNPKVIDDVKLTGFINGTTGVRAEVTRTFYTSSPIASGITQENLRNRVATTAYYPTSTVAYQHATHYSYDIHGNVKTLIQDFPGMGIPASANSKKRIDYRYDLISGNVLQVSYQAGAPDQYYHRYEYDADNRITAVYTSDYGWEGATASANLNMPEDMMFWEKDAVYRYYKHGPLAKVELGELGVQGVDYAYTLQGWLKGVNSTKLDEVNDMGKDGNLAMNTPYQYFARDAFSFNLSYFEGDYSPIRGPQVGTATCWLADNAGSFTQANRFDLWNGNIGAMATTLNTGGSNPMNLYQNMAYQYDQLNRLVSAVGQGNYNESTNKWGATADIANRYKNEFTYDPNGNILTQKRRDQAGVLFDDLRYRYNYNLEGRFIDNRLYHVSDNIGAAVKTDDIDNQTGNVVFGPNVRANYAAELNYFYDELGQLIRDKQEKIENITWRVDGKISYISRNNGSGKSELAFVYDAMGNRVEKTVNNDAGAWSETEYYVRDAQGNVMAIYKKNVTSGQMNYILTEQHIYGSSRLGVDKRGVDVIAASTVTDNVSRSIKRGEKHYELSNHLGNVLATVSDKKIAVMSGANLSYYRADVVSYSDYYPFGAPMTERTAVVTPTDVRYGFQGKEMDGEIAGNGNAYDFGARMYDARLGRWWSVDPSCFTQPDQSTYKAFKNNGIIFSDPNGETEWLRVIVKDNYGHMFAFRVAISDDVMTDGVKHRSKIFVFGQPWGEHVWNEWYDFETTVTYTIDQNGELIGPAVIGETKILFSNGAKDTDSFNIDDDKYGDTKDPDGLNNLQGVGEVQNSGFFFTGGNGDYATKTKGKFDGETVDIADFLTAVTAFTKDPSSLPDVKKALGPAEFAGLISEWTSTVDEAIKLEKKKAASTNQTKTENDSIWVCYDLHYIIGKSGAIGTGGRVRVSVKDTTEQVVNGDKNKKIVPCN